ncbi:MAG: hypothetical protein V4559_02435 [Pseudomonadota bacterium]
MHTYETCLIGVSGKVSIFVSASHFSDSAAIHAAHGMCKHGELAQIWRDDVCIHNDTIAQKRIGSSSP